MSSDFSRAFQAFDTSRKFRARWIWDGGEADPRNAVRLFRKEFNLADSAPEALIHIAADTRYILWVNGRRVGRGAPQSQPWHQYYDTRPVGEMLVKGANCIAVLVYHLGTMDFARGGLLAELTDAENRLLVGTDETWKAATPEAYWPGGYRCQMNAATPFQEFFDAGKWPAGWDAPGFDDAAWTQAGIVRGRISDRPGAAGPWARLVPRDIPEMTDEPVYPRQVAYVEECIDLMNRNRAEDLSIRLSVAGGELKWSRVENSDNLCTPEGQTLVQCSTEHLRADRVGGCAGGQATEPPFDGRYDPCIVLDFGQVVTGRPRIEIQGPAGGVMDIGYAERLTDGRFVNAIECQFSDRLIFSGGSDVHEPLNWKAFRFLKLRFSNCDDPAVIRDFRAQRCWYPFEPRGNFTASDAKLESIWNISRETLRLCSNEFLMDTPFREQAQWLGDVSAVTLGGIYACFGDPALPGKYIRQVAANQMPTGMLSNVSNAANPNVGWLIPDYSLWWIWGLWNHYLYTGEARWVHEFYPTALKAMQTFWHHVNDDGLIEDLPWWVFVDWANTDRRGEPAAVNALYYAAMGHLEKMAEMVGDAHHLAKIRLGRSRLAETFTEALYDPRRGAFADTRIDGKLSDNTSEHASMTAIWAGLCEEKLSAEIVRRFYVDREIRYVECQPFYTSVVLEALRGIGRIDLAIEIIRDRWGRRMVDRGATSTYEEWTHNGSWRSGQWAPITRTHSHAWSGCPAEFLIKGLAGVEILAAGGTEVRVSPAQTHFDYDVTYPLPAGSVRVKRAGGQSSVETTGGVTVQR